MSPQQIVALVGRRDEPTDGVADYCGWLGGALKAFGCEFQLFRVGWPELGWTSALAELNKSAKQWNGRWALLQYTALAWSARGFPGRVLKVISVLKTNHVRCAVVFHDFRPFPGDRIIDRVRRAYQLRILRRLYRSAEIAVFTAPISKIGWLPADDRKSQFIPVGANCPEPDGPPPHSKDLTTVAVYGVTGGSRMTQEVRDIGDAVKQARCIAGTVRLLVLGRGSQEASSMLQAEFAGTGIDLEILGVLSAENVSQTLARADVLLFIRGGISTRRGSAIAGIACGLPIVAFESVDTAWPLTEAGVLLVPDGDREALSAALVNVLSDPVLRLTLGQRSRNAQQKYFSWRAIAERFIAVLDGTPTSLGNGRLADAENLARKI